MKVEHCPRSTTFEINMSYTTNTTVQARTMDLGSMLNPTAGEASVDLERRQKSEVDEGMTEEQELKREVFHHQLPFHTKPTPVEIGGVYAPAYPTPANSPELSYSTIIGPQASLPNRGRSQPLPSFQQVNQMLLNYSSTQPALAYFQAELEALEQDCSHRLCKARQQCDYPHRTSPHSRRGYRRPQSAPTHGHRVSRATHDSLRRSSNASKSSIQKLNQRQKVLVHPAEKAPPHSNQPYHGLGVDWMRYQRIDLNEKWEVISSNFEQFFPGERKSVSKGGLSSRFYRDNLIPALDIHGNTFVDKAGKLVVLNVQCRTKDKGEHANSPWTFVERHPWLALQHPFVSSAYKADAARIIAEIEAKDPSRYTRKQQYTVKIREFDANRSIVKTVLPTTISHLPPSAHKIINGVWQDRGDDANADTLDDVDDDLYDETEQA